MLAIGLLNPIHCNFLNFDLFSDPTTINMVRSDQTQPMAISDFHFSADIISTLYDVGINIEDDETVG